MNIRTASYRYITKFLSGLSLGILLLSCDKSITEHDIAPVAPASIDENGGNWKPILLSSSTAIPIPAPTATNSAEYQSELQEVKTLQSNLTGEMKKTVQYWAANPVLRWNEITRELVAKYNLPPASNPDGSYSAPDATNPTIYPLFPFSNPPYAARAYAMLTVAQYDALVAAWQYKYAHNRPAPSTIDASITSLVPSTSLPSYPSDDAVIAAASLTILKALFPGEVEFLNAKAAEHKNSRLWAGANVKSDIAAGDSLGRKVAQQILARAKADGMATAAGNKDIWKAYEEATLANGQTPWLSQEIPARPPMLMSFGKVKPWMFSDAEVIALRPLPPPAIGSAEFNQALAEVKNYSENITREQWRIVSFWADGVGTYTPPGHWNAIASDIIVKNRMNSLRTARTLAMMNAAMADAAICTWDVKYLYYLPRPSQIDPSIKTATGLPNFPSYTSGHSTFSGAAATVLSYIFPEEKNKVEAMAVEASESRIYGAIHYRFDCEVGLQCGRNIAAFAVERGKADGSAQ